MAIPTQPTKTTLATEGLKMAGYPSPAAGQLTRAEDEYIEKVKWDIWEKGTKWKSLMIHAYCVTIKGVNRYALPDDHEHILSMQILQPGQEGDVTAVASANSFTLDSNADQSTESMQGKIILIKAGTAKGAASQVDDWDNTTKVVSVIPDLSTTPDATSDYMIIDRHYNLKQKHIWRLDDVDSPMTLDLPRYYFPIGQGNADSDETGEFYLYPTPNDVYGVQMRYYANLQLVDIASNLMKTLYRRWRNLFIYGIYYHQLVYDRDERMANAEGRYFRMIDKLAERELYGHNLSNMSLTVKDYA